MCFVLLLIQAVLLWGPIIIMGGHIGPLAKHTQTFTHMHAYVQTSLTTHACVYSEYDVCTYTHVSRWRLVTYMYTRSGEQTCCMHICVTSPQIEWVYSHSCYFTHSRIPAGPWKQTAQNMAFVFLLNTRIPAKCVWPTRQQPSSWQSDVQFVRVISHEGRLYGTASSI